LGDGSTITRDTPIEIGDGFVEVVANELHSLGIKSDGTLWAWGQNTYGQLGDGTKANREEPIKIKSFPKEF
jgi:alpha-tubulin suppressor-like RCC1 family protein